MPYRVFALDSTYATAPDHSTVMAALTALNAAKVNFTPTITTRQTSYDSDVVLVCVNVTDAELAADDDLINLRQANYPNAHCQHKWESLASFRISGFHALNESVRSVFAVAGRSARFIRPQQDYGETADNYGAGDGTNHFNAFNGREDTGTRQLATDYFLSGNAIMYPWDDASDPGNAVTDATGMGAASRIREMSDPDWPAMIWSGGRIWDRASDGAKVPFELYDATNDVYVCGGFRNNGAVGSTSTYMDLDLPSSALTLNATLLLQRYSLTGKASLSDLDGSGGQCRFHQPSAQSTSIISATFTFDGTSTYVDETFDSRANPADSEIVPVGAANDQAFYIGMPFKFSEVYLRSTDTAGGRVTQPQIGGTYVLEYYNGSTWGTFATVDDGSSGLTVISSSSKAYWVPPSDWTATTVNSWGPYYYIRWRKTGGTVTQACNLEWWEAGNDGEPWDAVKVFDGSSTYTDYLWEAINPTTDDIPALPVSAANGAGLYFCAAKTFSQAVINLSQVQVGATMAIQYSLGSGSWGNFTNINDPSASLTSGTSQQIIEFNPKIDWATDTVDGVEGYWIRIVKTAGTVTQAARLDSATSFRERSIFIHRYDDQPVVNGMTKLTAPAATGSSARGKLETDGKGNIEFHRVRSFGLNLLDTTTDELFFYGCQYVLGGELRLASGTRTWTMAAGQYGTRWWDIDDHEVQDKTEGPVPNILARIQWAIDNRDSTTTNNVTGNTIGEDIETALAAAGITDPDITAFDDIPDWNDFMLFGEGTYGSGGVTWTKIFDGCKFRHVGSALDGINDTEIYVAHGIDGHSDALYGHFDGEDSPCQFTRIGFEQHSRAVNYYPQGVGNNDKPVQVETSSPRSERRNMHFHYCYFDTSTSYDGGRGWGGILFEADGDAGEYDTGYSGAPTRTGRMENTSVLFCGFKDIPSAAAVLSITSSDVPRVWFNEFDNVGSAVFVSGGFNVNGPRSTNAVTFDGSSTYNDVTHNLKDSGNTITALYSSGSAGAILYLGIRQYFTRTFTFDITTAAVGGPTLAWEYWNGSTWAAVTNLSDGTSGFTVDGTVTFNRPTDAAQTTIDSKLRYWVRCRIASGSFSTIPEAVEISTVFECAGADMQFNTIRNCQGGAGSQSVMVLFVGVGTHLTNAGVYIEGNNTIYMMEGQDSSVKFYDRNGGLSGDWTLAEWQALSKPAATTDAPQDCVFGVDTVLVPFA